MYKNLVEQSYSDSGIGYIYRAESEQELNCFVKSPPLAYPPKFSFEVYEHTLKKDDEFILKFGDGGRAVVAVRDDEFRIIDMFLSSEYQNKGILKAFIREIKVKIFSEYPTIRYVTLSAISSGIIAWHKIGFEFYVIAHKNRVRAILSKAVGRIDEVANFSKEEIEESSGYEALEVLSGVPMYMEVKR